MRYFSAAVSFGFSRHVSPFFSYLLSVPLRFGCIHGYVHSCYAGGSQMRLAPFPLGARCLNRSRAGDRLTVPPQVDAFRVEICCEVFAASVLLSSFRLRSQNSVHSAFRGRRSARHLCAVLRGRFALIASNCSDGLVKSQHCSLSFTLSLVLLERPLAMLNFA